MAQCTPIVLLQTAKNAEIFLNGVNSSIAMHNVSTQFADGGEFGFGGEIGISTNKLPPKGASRYQSINILQIYCFWKRNNKTIINGKSYKKNYWIFGW